MPIQNSINLAAKTNEQLAIGLPNPGPNNLDVNGSAAIGAPYAGTVTAPANGMIVAGSVGIAVASPSALLHLGFGTATSSGAPLKFSEGTLLEMPEPGAVEYDGISTFITYSDSARQSIAMIASSLQNHGVVLGSVNSTLVTTLPGTEGQVLIGGGSDADPAFATITSTGLTLDFTPGVNSLNIDIASPVVVSYGGTGATSLTDHGVLLGQGTDPVIATTLSDGQLLIGSTGNDPVAATLTAGTNVTITNGAGSITIAALSDLSYPIIVSQGGTGRTSLTSRSVLIGAGTASVSFSNVGTNGQVLIAGGTDNDPAFATITSTGLTLDFTPGVNSLNIDIASPVVVSYGGTGATSLTDHGVLLGQGTDPVIATTLSDGQLLIGSTGNDPVAATLTAGTNVTITNGAGSITIAALSDLSYPIIVSQGGTGRTSLTSRSVLIGAGTASVSLSNVGTNGQVLIAGGTDNDPAFATITSTGLTLDFTPGVNSLNIDIASPVVVSYGGTGATSLTDHGVLLGQGTDPVIATTLSDGQLLIGSTGNDPVAATLTAGTNVTITNEAGSITIAALSDLSYPIIVSQGGTGRTSLTSRSVLIGAGTASVSLSNVGTNGQVLIAGGTDNDPAFATITSTGLTLDFTPGVNSLNIDIASPVVVSYGGTGKTSFTAYSVLCAGTTSTGAFQNVSGVGSTGQVLSSNGAGALPSWTALSSLGVTSVTGTTNQITASPTTGDVVVSLTDGISIGSYQATTPPTGGIIVPGSVGIGTDVPSFRLTSTTTSAGSLDFQLQLQNSDNTLGTAAAMLFATTSTGSGGKGGLAYVRTNSNARGDFYFLQNATANASLPTLSDVAMILTNNKKALMGFVSDTAIASSVGAAVQVGGLNSSSYQNISYSALYNRDTATGPVFAFGKGRGNVIGGTVSVQDADTFGELRFAGANGVDLQSIGAAIRAQVSGTPSSTSMPGKLIFSTTPTGATSPTDRLYLDATGNVGVRISTPTAYLHLAAGAASPLSAPLKFSTGNNLTSPETGAMEFSSNVFYLTPSSTRLAVALMSSSFLTNHGVVLGTGGATLSSTAVGTTGQVLTGNTGADPTWTALSSLGVTSVSGTTNQITASPTTGDVVVSLTNGISIGSYQATTPPTGGIICPGAVGIGATSPIGNLHVMAGTSNAAQKVVFMNPSTTSLNVPPTVAKASTVYIINGDISPPNNPASLSLIQFSATATAISYLSFVATRATIAEINAGTFVPVQTGDLLGFLAWGDDDGTNMRSTGIELQGIVAGTPTSGIIPSNLIFSLDAAADSFRQRAILYGTGNLGVGARMDLLPAIGGTIEAYDNNSSTSGAIGLMAEQDGSGDALVQWYLTGGQQYIAGIDNSDSDKWKLGVGTDLNTSPVLTVTSAQLFGVRQTTPTAYLHLGAGATSASSAPLKFTSGTLMTTPEAGAMEYNGDFYLTNSTPTRRPIALGPSGASSTDNAIARWDGASGTILQNSGVIIDDSNNITGVNTLNISGASVSALVVNTSTLVANTVANRVGVNTASPVSRLHVFGSDAATGTSAGITVETSNASGDAIVQFLLSNSGQRWVVGADNSLSDAFVISSTADLSTPRIVVDTTGNVGIAPATSPFSKLYIAQGLSAASSSAFSTLKLDTGIAPPLASTYSSVASLDTEISSSGTGAVTTLYGIRCSVSKGMSTTTSNAYTAYLQGTVNSAGTLTNAYTLYLTNPSGAGITNAYSAILGDSAGSLVGIGTNAPTSPLYISENSSGSTGSTGINIENLGSGDTAIHFRAGGAVWSTGIDNSDSEKFKIAPNVDVGTNTAVSITTAGQINYPLQPAFHAYVASNATPSFGSAYTIIFDTETFDVGSNYNTSTGIFTAPVAGKYLFTCSVGFTQSVTHLTLSIDLVTTSQTIRLVNIDPDNLTAAGDVGAIGGSCIVLMSATDTAQIQFTLSGGSAGTNVILGVTGGITYNTFSGQLIA